MAALLGVLQSVGVMSGNLAASGEQTCTGKGDSHRAPGSVEARAGDATRANW